MGTNILTTVCILLLLTTRVADSKDFNITTSTKEYLVEAKIDRYPLTLGDNNLEIKLRDGSGRGVVDAEVVVNYYMPPMPRMVPMNYRTEAHLENDKYEAKLNIIMAGPWYIKIIITQSGKISTTKFNVDAQ